MLTRRLRKNGYDVIAAVDGRQALSFARQILPDLILMDISIPEINGLEVTGTLKVDSKTSHIPIIVLTAHAMKRDRENALAAGADEFETKPIAIPQLLKKMKTLLHKKSSS